MGTGTAPLSYADATVDDSYTLLESLYEAAELPTAACYQGSLCPTQVAAVMTRRLARERAALQDALGVMLAEEMGGADDGGTEDVAFTVQSVATPDMLQGLRYELRLQG